MSGEGSSFVDDLWRMRGVAPITIVDTAAPTAANARQALAFVIVLAGTLTATRTLILPQKAGASWLVENGTGQTVNVRGPTGAGVDVAAGATAQVYSTGTRFKSLTASLSASLDTLLGSVQGLIPYRGESAWAGLPNGGTSDKFLRSPDGDAANPSWGDMDWDVMAPITDSGSNFTSAGNVGKLVALIAAGKIGLVSPSAGTNVAITLALNQVAAGNSGSGIAVPSGWTGTYTSHGGNALVFCPFSAKFNTVSAAFGTVLRYIVGGALEYTGTAAFKGTAINDRVNGFDMKWLGTVAPGSTSVAVELPVEMTWDTHDVCSVIVVEFY